MNRTEKTESMDPREAWFTLFTFALLYYFCFSIQLNPLHRNLLLMGVLTLLFCLWMIRRKRPQWLAFPVPELGPAPSLKERLVELACAYLRNLTQSFSDGLQAFCWALMVVAQLFFFSLNLIPSASMLPNFLEGDRVIVNKTTFGLRLPWDETRGIGGRKPKRGEVVCFYAPKSPSGRQEELFIKRVIGVPGDLIKVTANTLEVTPAGGGKPSIAVWKIADLSEDWARGKAINSTQATPLIENLMGLGYPIQFVNSGHRNFSRENREETWLVPEGHYFMMGDNRNNSSDSRTFGCVPEAWIVAKPILILCNKPQDKGFLLNNLRISRCFQWVPEPSSLEDQNSEEEAL